MKSTNLVLKMYKIDTYCKVINQKIKFTLSKNLSHLNIHTQLVISLKGL
jgi:hypothetical protein